MSETVSNETVELDEKAAELVPVIQKSNEGFNCRFIDENEDGEKNNEDHRQLTQLLNDCVTQIKFRAAVDVEANSSHSGSNNCLSEEPLNNGKQIDAAATAASSQSDPIQHAMGQFGKWHFLVCGIIFLLKFPVAWHQMSIIFIAPNVDSHCVNPNVTDECSVECPYHDFDKTIFTETIQSTWDLVCDRSQWANMSQTIFMFGILVGNIMFGTLADKYGRRNPLVAAVFIQLITGVATAFAPWFWLFCILRFLTAAATGGTMVTSFVLVMELIGTKWRELVSVLYQVPFNLGHLTLPLFAYYLRDWHELQFALSIPSIVLISYYWLVPESPRWLFTVGRVDESAAVLEQAAAFNSRPTESIKLDLEKYALHTHISSTVSRGNMLDLVRTPNIRSKTLCMCFNWFVCGLAFFGVAQYIGQSDGNIFLNVAISAALELPGTLLCIYTMKRFGRKRTLIASNTLAGVCMLLIAIKPSASVPLASTALIGMSISFPTVYLYAGELFPTVVRNIGVGTASMIARIGSMVAPFIIALKVINIAYPPIILGVIPIIGACLVLLLPETRGQPLPATIEDAENFGKKVKAKNLA